MDYIYIQQETEKILNQYRDKLNDLSDSQMDAVACLAKDIFKLGANFGAEIVSKIK
jgi:hypothetical protein